MKLLADENQILKKVREIAYWLKLPPSARIHSVFLISQLKKSAQPILTSQLLPSCLSEEMELVSEPEEIVKTRRLTNGQEEVQVKW